MEIIKKIEVKSGEANHLLDKKLKGGGSFVIAAIIQISKAYSLAKQEYLYPYIGLIRISGEMAKVRATMEKLIQDFEKVLGAYKTGWENRITKVKATYEIRVSNPVAGELLNLIELFDHLSCLLWTANNLNLFKEDRHKYFRAVDHNAKRILGVMKLIFALSQNGGEAVTISQYLDKDEISQDTQKTLGTIKPALLFSALHIDSLPRFSAQRRNTILKKLKKM